MGLSALVTGDIKRDVRFYLKTPLKPFNSL